MHSDDMEGGMVYQDEEGNLIMYNHDDMMDDEDGDGHHHMDDYGMEGEHEVSNGWRRLKFK